MILDVLENKEKYEKLVNGFDKAFAFIQKCNASTEVGRYEIDGDKVYAMVQEYTTKTEGSFEAHQRYIDIQYIISGTEIIEWGNINKLTISNEYDEAKDVAFYHDSEEISKLYMTEGSFAIFFPEDAHKPCMSAVKSSDVQKIVAKIKID